MRVFYRALSRVGRTPWSAADTLVGLVGISSNSRERDRGVPRGPGGPPHLGVRIAVIFPLLLFFALTLHAQTYDLVLRARAVMQERLSYVRNVIAAGYFEQALRKDPRSVEAMAGAATILIEENLI